MEETFKGRQSAAGQASHQPAPDDGRDRLDLQSMVTSNCTLLIGGPRLPSLKLTNLAGIMRVRVLGNGDTELRFDRYRGTFAEGLPTGRLVFHDVVGEVVTSGKRLLQFDGLGQTGGSNVAFELDIFTKPERRVEIDAVFPRRSLASLRSEAVSLWSEFSESVKLRVHEDPRVDARAAKP